MALFIEKEPDTLMPIHSPMYYEVSSTLFNEKNFKIVFTITTSTTRVVKVSPRPVDNRVEFDISSHLKDYLNLDSFNPNSTVDVIAAPYVDYQVDIHEEYNDSITNSLVVGTATVMSLKTATNIVLNRSEYLNYTEEKWINNETEGVSFVDTDVLLNSGVNSSYYRDDIIWIHNSGLGILRPLYDIHGTFTPTYSVRHFRLSQYDKNGIELDSDTVSIGSTNSKNIFYKLDLSDTSLYNINSLTVKIGIQFIDPYGGTDTPLTNNNKYNLLDTICLPYQNFKLLYLDKLGSYNTINLGYKSNENVEIKKENFRKRINPLNDNDYNRGLQTHFIKYNDTYTLNTGNLNQDDMARFEDMLLSTRVFLDVRNNSDVRFNDMNYVPLIINTNSMRRFKSENQELAQYTVKCELAYELNLRRR